MMCTCEQLFKRLEVAEAMRAFISHHTGNIEEMHSKLERVEADLTTAQKVVADGTEILKLAKREKWAIWAEGDQLKRENEALKAQVKGQGGRAREFSAQEGDGRTPGQFRGSKEGDGRAARWLGCSKEGDGGRICRSEEGAGDGVSEAGRRDVLLRLSLLYEEE